MEDRRVPNAGRAQTQQFSKRAGSVSARSCELSTVCRDVELSLPAVRHYLPAGDRKTSFIRGLGGFFGPADLYAGIFLDRTDDARGGCGVSGMPGPAKLDPALAVIIAFRMLDLDGRICAADIDPVIALFHMRRKVGQSKLPIQ
jgi:hypothetical protein